MRHIKASLQAKGNNSIEKERLETQKEVRGWDPGPESGEGSPVMPSPGQLLH